MLVRSSYHYKNGYPAPVCFTCCKHFRTNASSVKKRRWINRHQHDKSMPLKQIFYTVFRNIRLKNYSKAYTQRQFQSMGAVGHTEWCGRNRVMENVCFAIYCLILTFEFEHCSLSPYVIFRQYVEFPWCQYSWLYENCLNLGVKHVHCIWKERNSRWRPMHMLLKLFVERKRVFKRKKTIEWSMILLESDTRELIRHTCMLTEHGHFLYPT